MTITFHLSGYIVPTITTFIALAIGAFVFWRDANKCQGDYAFPIMGFLAIACAIVASVVSWFVFVALHFVR